MKMLNNEKGFALIWMSVVALMLLALMGSFCGIHAGELKQATTQISQVQAFYLAESGIDHMLYKLNDGDTSGIAQTSFGNGTYQVLYNAGTKTITSTGIYGGVTRTVTTVVQGNPNSGPPGVKASVTAPSRAFVILGIIMDGREHDSSGNLTGAPGTYGLAFGDDPTFDGWVMPKIGGNGYAPAQPVPDAAKLHLNDSQVADAASPETVLGLPPSSTLLNQYKSTSPPSAPLNNQIYYYTPTSPGSLLSPAATINMAGGSGILIVNNTNKNSWVKLRGEFTGLVVCNNCIFEENTEITGAVTSVDPVQGDFWGPLTTLDHYAEINYSSEVLQNLPPIAGAPPAAGVTVKHWIDNQNSAGRLTASST